MIRAYFSSWTFPAQGDPRLEVFLQDADGRFSPLLCECLAKDDGGLRGSKSRLAAAKAMLDHFTLGGGYPEEAVAALADRPGLNICRVLPCEIEHVLSEVCAPKQFGLFEKEAHRAFHHRGTEDAERDEDEENGEMEQERRAGIPGICHPHRDERTTASLQGWQRGHSRLAVRA